MSTTLSRRDFIKLAGGAAVAAVGAGLLPGFLRKIMTPEQVVQGAGDYDLFFAGTDGWMHLPPSPAIPPWHPDTYAPSPFTTYIFGFRDVSLLNDAQRQNQKMKAQHNAPFFWVDQFNPGDPKDFKVQLTNLGLQQRPDLTDSHTLHWHGFRNVIPFFDGEPTGSVSVPVEGLFTYVYRPRDPGTYMYHCHVEDIEHVTMGMTGIVFVRPLQDGQSIGGFTKFAYNDGDGSTGYNREFPMFLSEVWAEGHWNDAHIQESQWYNFKADFSLLNGRVYPDTLLPNSPVDVANSTNVLKIKTDGNGDLLWLLRFANLGFREAAMTFAGLNVRVVGRDATPMRGRDGTDTSFETNTLLMGAGESYDAVLTAPSFSGGSGSSGLGYDAYVLYNRRYTQDDDQSTQGQRTEIRVYPAGTLGPQAYLNQHPDDTVA
ncbi:MAG: multicopper oxidase [Chloroflexi bacterium]|nr:multicopper oxidase [Chloroflexota bacterium]